MNIFKNKKIINEKNKPEKQYSNTKPPAKNNEIFKLHLKLFQSKKLK